VRVAILDSHTLGVSAERPVKGFVFQQTREMGAVSDNGFDLVGGIENEVVVRFEKGIDDGRALRWTYLGAPGAEMGLDH
jgi:hypothetical protein